MRKLAILAGAMLFALALPATAQPDGCMPSDTFMNSVKAHPDFASATVVPSAAVAAARDLFNAVPPEADTPWTEAVVVDFGNGGGALIVGIGGLWCGALGVGPEHWPAVRRGIMGTGA